ncbi:hypothetical protein [Magnetospirillum sp. SS-4]|uniref:hypothetical protein n=1 Tax=Magnetospirillum sp. SS-4 TaxID=2681465 RepID=UPI001573BB8E|nr:hypothetical protein [Magnetospirillum sp. SS-4]
MEEIKEFALRSQAAGKVSASIGTLFARGLPGLLGEDLSGRAGEGDFLASSARSPEGPFLDMVGKALELGGRQAALSDQLANLSAGIGKPLKALEAAANGMPFYDAALRPTAFFEALADGKIAYASPWRRGALDFDESIIGHGDLARMAVGGSPVKVAQARDVAELARRQEERVKRVGDRTMTQIVAAYRRHQGDPAEQQRVITNLIVQAREKGANITANQVRSAIRNAEVPAATRAVRQAPRQLRPGLSELEAGVVERGGSP